MTELFGQFMSTFCVALVFLGVSYAMWGVE